MSNAAVATVSAVNARRVQPWERPADRLIQAIQSGQLHAGNISLAAIRHLGARDNGLHGQLDHGRRILRGERQLQQYLRSYAPMVQRQWQALYALKPVAPAGRFHVIDHGCGQGLATAHLFDALDRRLSLSGHVASVTLIEPSADALQRAGHIVRAWAPQLPVTCLNQRIEAVDVSRLPAAGSHYLHLFSNVLDIPGFDPMRVLGWMLDTPGSHTLLAVSHDRHHNGGSLLLRNLHGHLCALRRSGIHLRVNQLHQYQVAMSSGIPAPVIAWQMQLQVA